METRAEGCSVTRALLDPNVLISARISNKGAPRELLYHWIAGDFEMVASPEVLFELQEVLVRPKFRRYLTYADALEYVFWIHDMVDVSEEVCLDVLQGAVPADPDDDYLAALAYWGEARVIVSGDKHLLDIHDRSITSAKGEVLARILTPHEFLDELR